MFKLLILLALIQVAPASPPTAPPPGAATAPSSPTVAGPPTSPTVAGPPTMPGAPPTMPGAPPTMPGAPPTMPGAPPTMPGAPPTMPGAPNPPPSSPAPSRPPTTPAPTPIPAVLSCGNAYDIQTGNGFATERIEGTFSGDIEIDVPSPDAMIFAQVRFRFCEGCPEAGYRTRGETESGVECLLDDSNGNQFSVEARADYSGSGAARLRCNFRDVVAAPNTYTLTISDDNGNLLTFNAIQIWCWA